MVPRRPMEQIDLLSPCAQVVVGMRRCGKSVLCRLALQAHPEIKYGYIDFDDETLAMYNEPCDTPYWVVR